LLKRLKLFADLDLLQICILNLYLGGLVLYLIAMLPFQFFSKPVAFGLTAIGFIFSALFHLRHWYRHSSGKIRRILIEHKMAALDYILVFGMFLIFLWVQLTPLTNFVFGSVHDTSLHSLMVQVILENNCVPMTLQPYLPEGIIYPQASHVIFTYASYMLNYEAPKTLFYVTPLFNALSVFGAYFLGKKLWAKRSFYLGLSFVFAFVSSWPLYVTWGGNPFVTGFPLFLICLGLFFAISPPRKEHSAKELVAIGIFFGYSAAIVISYLETLLVVGVFWLFFGYARRSSCLGSMVKKLLLIFSVSLLPFSPFLSRFIMFYPYPGHNIGVPSDFLGYQKLHVSLNQVLEGAFEHLSPYLFLRVELVGLFACFGVFLWKVRGNGRDLKRVLFFITAVAFSSALLSFISNFLPTEMSFISLTHQSIVLSIPMSVVLTVFYMKLSKLIHSLDSGRLSKVFPKRSHAAFLVSIMALAAINMPFVYSRIAVDPKGLSDSYGLFAITTEDDYRLMVWMKENLSSSAIVLVNPYEAGLFIPSTSNHRIIFPFVASQRAHEYQRLVDLFSQSIINQTALELMQNYNISHVFVGVHATFGWTGSHKWDAQMFLSNSNFRLVERVGDSYLIEFSSNGTELAS